MTNDEQIQISKNIETVSSAVEELLTSIRMETDIPTAEILAASHAQVVCMMAAMLGGEVAAEQCIRASKHIKHTPSIQDALLMAATPQGNA